MSGKSVRGPAQRTRQRQRGPQRRTSLCRLLPLLALNACSASLDANECDRLLDVYSEKLLRSVDPRLSANEIVEKQLRIRQLAHERPEFEFNACMKRVRRSQYDCALAAPDVNAIERCLTL